MSKRKQRRGSNQRVVVNPYHNRHVPNGTVLPMPEDVYGLFDPMTRLKPFMLTALVVLMALGAFVGVVFGGL